MIATLTSWPGIAPFIVIALGYAALAAFLLSSDIEEKSQDDADRWWQANK